jgi:hypothetical protein
MTKTFSRIRQRVMPILLVGTVFASLAGCTKKEDNNDAAKFGGTWKMTANCTGSSPSSGDLIFTATDNKTVTTSYSVGSGSCAKAKVLTGTANGNTVTFNTTTITDACGGSYSVSATGTISGGTFTFSLSVNGAANGVCTFVGTK